jgi:hypothetical protein
VRIWIGVLVAATLPLAACDTLGPDRDEQVTVSFAAGRTGFSAVQSASLVPISDGTHTVDLQSVSLTLDKIVLREEGVKGTRGSERDSDKDSDGRSRNLRFGAITIDLPLTGGVITPISTVLPNGTFDQIGFDVLLVRLRGTFDGQPFDATIPVNGKVDLEIDPAFVVDSGDDHLNITIALDPSSWLRLANGAVIDLRNLQSDESLRRSLAQKIRASFRAFEDSDHDADDHDSDSDSDKRHH